MVKKKDRSSAIPLILTVLILGGFLLLVGSGALLVKEKMAKHQISQLLTEASQNSNAVATEDAMMFATTLGYVAPNQLQTYVATLSKQTGRDIVVVDKKEIIMADAISANVGKEYTEDKGEELKMTVSDGQVRMFMETSSDYPQGISEVVVPMKDSNGTITGAVIMSPSKMFGKSSVTLDEEDK